MLRNGVEGIFYNFCDQVAWEPKQTLNGVDFLLRLANRALLQISQDAPFLFTETTKSIFTIPTFRGAPNDKLITVDAWTLKRVSQTNPNTDWPVRLLDDYIHPWTGMVIKIQDTTGGPPTEHRIRSVFVHEFEAEFHECITLWESHVGNTEKIGGYTTPSEYTYTVYQREMFVPQDFKQINSIIVQTPQGPMQGQISNEREAEAQFLKDIQSGITLSWPYKFYRRGMFTLPAPSTKPRVEIIEDSVWDGEEPAGKFVYAYTICYGVTDIRYDSGGPANNISSDLRVRPLVESTLSPVSESIETTYGGPRIKITTQDIAYESGFRKIKGTAQVRNNQSGMYITIYRARLFNSDTHAGDTVPLMQDPFAFYKIGTIFEIDNKTTWVDDGSRLPDKSSPYIPSNGNQLLSVYPYPDDAYRVDLRGILRPNIYNFYQDASNYPPEVDELVLLKMLEYYYSRVALPSQSNIERAKYAEQLGMIKKEFAQLGPDSRIINRLPAPGMTGDMVRFRKLWSGNGN